LFLAKVAAAVSIMALALWASMGSTQWWLDAHGAKRLPAVMGLVLLGAVTYGACLFAFGFRPRDFSRRAAA
jgi:putative peptidoglycan lipid II flippase